MNLRKNFRFRVGCDVDDVLLPCMELAIEWANKEYNFNPPITLEELKTWTPSGGRTDVIFKYFNKREFFEAQQPFEGARGFIKKLSEKAEVFIVTAMAPSFMGIRAEQIRQFFPEISEKNIIPAYRKDIVDLDFLLDDGAHNILASNVKYPVLFRKPWNAHMTGILSVNSYDEFLNLLECIKKSYLDNSILLDQPSVIALVGPSGSGKTVITEKVLEHESFEKPISATTRRPRAGESKEAYHFVSDEAFIQMKKEERFAETTVYAGYHYGAELSSINHILKSGKHCIIPIDISGAMALKMQYRTCVVYVKRERPELIDALIQRMLDGKMTKDDTIQRIVSLSDEKRNEEVCDYILVNNGTIEEAAQKILSTMKLK